MVCLAKKVPTLVVCMLMAVFLVGCGFGSRGWVVGQRGPLERADKADADAGLVVARRYIAFWVAKDYRGMFDLQCAKSTGYWHGNYTAFKRLASTWRERGIKNTLGLRANVNGKELISSLRIVLNISDNQAKILLAVAMSDERALQELARCKWPSRVMFLRHTLGEHHYILIAVKEHQTWSIMNAPGQLPLSMITGD